ncbi:MAG: hypothetical protein IT315_03620 [Anaerolineales bacterium]|nr:hypothetical protein [Anaerolineales bacterium]
MKVKDLITLLSQMPTDANVIIEGYEGGVDDVVKVGLVKIKKDVNSKWYYGKYVIDEEGDVQAVFIEGEERQAK